MPLLFIVAVVERGQEMMWGRILRDELDSNTAQYAITYILCVCVCVCVCVYIYIYIYIYMYMYMYVCVCVCVCVRGITVHSAHLGLRVMV